MLTVSLGSRKCSACNKRKLQSDFHKRSGPKDGRNSICKTCRAKRRSVIGEMIRNSRSRAIRNGWEHDLTVEGIEELRDKQNNLCALTGKTLNWKVGNDGRQRVCPPDRASIDRIDNSRGYTLDNVQLVTDMANKMRSYYSLDDFINFCKAVAATQT